MTITYVVLVVPITASIYVISRHERQLYVDNIGLMRVLLYIRTVIKIVIDSILLGNIIAMIPFNVVVPTGAVAKSYVSALWNMPYTLDFDRFYDRVVASGPGGGKRKRRFKLGRISRISRNTKIKKPTRYRKKKRLTRRK